MKIIKVFICIFIFVFLMTVLQPFVYSGGYWAAGIFRRMPVLSAIAFVTVFDFLYALISQMLLAIGGGLMKSHIGCALAFLACIAQVIYYNLKFMNINYGTLANGNIILIWISVVIYVVFLVALTLYCFYDYKKSKRAETMTFEELVEEYERNNNL